MGPFSLIIIPSLHLAAPGGARDEDQAHLGGWIDGMKGREEEWNASTAQFRGFDPKQNHPVQWFHPKTVTPWRVRMELVDFRRSDLFSVRVGLASHSHSFIHSLTRSLTHSLTLSHSLSLSLQDCCFLPCKIVRC